VGGCGVNFTFEEVTEWKAITSEMFTRFELGETYIPQTTNSR